MNLYRLILVFLVVLFYLYVLLLAYVTPVAITLAEHLSQALEWRTTMSNEYVRLVTQKGSRGEDK